MIDNPRWLVPRIGVPSLTMTMSDELEKRYEPTFYDASRSLVHIVFPAQALAKAPKCYGQFLEFPVILRIKFALSRYLPYFRYF